MVKLAAAPMLALDGLLLTQFRYIHGLLLPAQLSIDLKMITMILNVILSFFLGNYACLKRLVLRIGLLLQGCFHVGRDALYTFFKKYAFVDF